MKRAFQMLVVLGIIGLISGLVLAGMYKYANPKIEDNKRRELDAAVYTVLPEAKSYKVITHSVTGDISNGAGEKKTLYQGFDGSGKLIGYAFKAKGSGYQGIIELMVGMNAGLTEIKGLEVLKSVETPGLGGKIVERGFKGQFAGLNVRPEIRLNQIDAITGATISSMSVVKILNAEIAEIRKMLK